jgi:hypothetical protein
MSRGSCHGVGWSMVYIISAYRLLNLLVGMMSTLSRNFVSLSLSDEAKTDFNAELDRQK